MIAIGCIIHSQSGCSQKLNISFWFNSNLLKCHYYHGRHIRGQQYFHSPTFFLMKICWNNMFFFSKWRQCQMWLQLWNHPSIEIFLLIKLLANNQIIFHKLSKWLKLTKLLMVTIVESVEDESFFFTYLSFTNNKLTNKLTKHLELVVHMYTKKNYLENFQFCYCDQSMNIEESLANIRAISIYIRNKHPKLLTLFYILSIFVIFLLDFSTWNFHCIHVPFLYFFCVGIVCALQVCFVFANILLCFIFL